MALAMLAYFTIFFTTLFGRREAAPAVVLPGAPPLHDEPAGPLRNFAPWVVAAIVLLAIAYVPPLYSVVTGPTQPAVAYDPSSPMPIAP